MNEIVIPGGPNGTGKTTVARILLPEFFGLKRYEYLNADEIAREISPQNVDAVAFAAGRRMIERMRELVSQRRSFAFETTCAAKSYLPLLERCKREGWRIALICPWLSSPDFAVSRVRRRWLRAVTEFRTRRSSEGSMRASGICLGFISHWRTPSRSTIIAVHGES